MDYWLLLAKNPSLESGIEDGDMVGLAKRSMGEPEQVRMAYETYLVLITEEAALEIDRMACEIAKLTEFKG